MNGLSAGEQKQALHHRKRGAAALPHPSSSTGPGAVYPSHTLTLNTTEELQPILTADQYLYGSIAPLLQVNNPSVNPETRRLDTAGEYLKCGQLITSTQNTCIVKARNSWIKQV